MGYNIIIVFNYVEFTFQATRRMNAVIPIKDRRSFIKDWELRYAVKSLDKFTNCENIIIIGKPRQKPNIPGCKVIWVDYRDKYRPINPLRHENVRRKVLKACHILEQPFMLTNDDIFFMQDFDIEEMPLYYNGTCKEFAENKGGKYKKMLQEIGGLNFELHTPMIIEPDIFQESTKEMKLYRSLYGNASDLPKQEMEDVKSYGKDSADNFRELPFISTSEAHLKGDVKRLIKKVVG